MLIRLSARIEGAANGYESPPSDEDVYFPASEDGNFPSNLNDLLTRKSISDEDASTRRKQIALVFRKRAAMKPPPAPTKMQATLDKQAALFRDLGLDDQGLQSTNRKENRPWMSNNPYVLLQDRDVDDDANSQRSDVTASPRPVAHTMMPAGGSPFWVRYGNKLRVNGTVEEVCVIG